MKTLFEEKVEVYFTKLLRGYCSKVKIDTQDIGLFYYHEIFIEKWVQI